MGAITDILQKFGVESVEIIQTNISRAGQNATGETSRQVMFIMPDPNRLKVDGPAYIFALETGRGPRESSQSSGLKGKIERWIQAKGISFSGTLEQAARGITWFINKHGTKLFREGGRRDIITPALDQSRFDKLTKDIADISLDLTLKKIDEGIKRG